MMPQLHELNNLPFTAKLALVGKGQAKVDEDGKLYLSLEAIDRLAQAMIAATPLYKMGEYIAANKVGAQQDYAEPMDMLMLMNAQRLATKFADAMESAIRYGIPLHQCFSKLMALRTEGLHVAPEDFRPELERWKSQVQAHQASRNAAVSAAASGAG